MKPKRLDNVTPAWWSDETTESWPVEAKTAFTLVAIALERMRDAEREVV